MREGLIAAAILAFLPLPAAGAEAPDTVPGGRLELIVTPRPTCVIIDDVPVAPPTPRPYALSPGRHVVRVAADGHDTERFEVDIPVGGKVVVRVRMRPSADGPEGSGSPRPSEGRPRPWYVGYGLVFSGITGMRNVYPFGIGQRVNVGWRWIGLDLRFEVLPISSDKTAEPGSWDSQVSTPVLAFGVGPRVEALPGWRVSPYVVLHYVHVVALRGRYDNFGALGGQVGARVKVHGPLGFVVEGGVAFPLEADHDEDHLLAIPERRTDYLWSLSSGFDVRF